MAFVWRLTLTVQSRHVSQRSRFVLSFHRSIREKSASKMPLTKLSRYSRLFRFPVRKDFLWKRCFQKPVPFLYSTRYIYILFAGEITWRRFSKLRTFSLLESENQCLKKCSIIGMLSSRTPISTTHLSSWNECKKDELRVFLTNVYIQILDACRSVERSIARDILLTTRKGKLWIGYSKW